jgi:hypothetical protein
LPGPIEDLALPIFGVIMSVQQKKDENVQTIGSGNQDCQRMVDYALAWNPVVKFMMEKLEEVSHHSADV